MKGGEFAIKVGNAGEKMMKDFLALVGWTTVASNESFECTDGKKHKTRGSKSDRETHNIDGHFFYDNPLNHNEIDVILCSSKHNQDGYADKSIAYSHLRDLAQSLECAPNDFNFDEKFDTSADKIKVYKGLLFWVSSNLEEEDESMVDKISEGILMDDNDDVGIGKLRGLSYNSIFMLDNRKLKFIYSAITTAKNRHPSSQIQFLFPHTGLNNRSEDLKSFGKIMPIQYINTSLLPIVVEDNGKISVLIFCDSAFEKEYLKRIIWLSHKITGLVGQVNVFFNNYDATNHDSVTNTTKGLFQESDLIDRISLHRINYSSFTLLKENNPLAPLEVQKPRQIQNRQKQILEPRNIQLPAEKDLDQILPYGEMIKPILAASILSETDLKGFLVRKGIYIGGKDKQSTVPLISTLLLSPKELDTLKYLLQSKEDKIKSVPRRSQLKDSSLDMQGLSSLLGNVVANFNKKSSLPVNSIFHKAPRIQKLDNQIVINYVIEKQNTTKDLITGKQHNEGKIIFNLSSGVLDCKIDYTSRETLQTGNKLFKKIEDNFLENGIIGEEFFSVKFNHFDNVSRIDFFLDFMKMEEKSRFKGPLLEYILIKPDGGSKEVLPFDLESLKNKVNELAIKGKELHSVHYFTDEYKTSLLMQRVKIKYEYNIDGFEHKCIVDLDFKNALNYGDVESELHVVLDIPSSRKTKGMNLNKQKQLLEAEFGKIIQSKYKHLQQRLALDKINLVNA